MSEVGLVPFARVALEVSREVVPAYSHRFSPQRFTQPQLLAILCLMRYEDWTFRAAEVRLAEHGELRGTLELQDVPDYTTLFRFMLRVEEQVIAQVLAEVSEPHGYLVGAGRGASFTHLIRVASPAGVAGGISIGARVRYRRDHNSIPVDVDVGRGRPAPGETHRIYSPHLAPRSLD